MPAMPYLPLSRDLGLCFLFVKPGNRRVLGQLRQVMCGLVEPISFLNEKHVFFIKFDERY